MKLIGIEAARRFAAQQKPPRAVAYRVVRNDAGSPARLDIYDDIGGGGWFGGGVSAQDVVDQLAGIDGDVEVHINSGGGDVFDGIAIYNSLASRAGNVTTVVDGLAASIASVIAQAGKTRVIAPGAMMMIHDALSMCIGNAADMRDTADVLDQVSDNLASVYASRGGTAAGWRAAMTAESWYSAQDAVDKGLADKLAERPAAPEDVAAHDFTMFAKVPAWLKAAAVPHGPMTGTHSHSHPAYGNQGGDQTHDHEHTHDGDAGHSHGHGDSTEDRGQQRILGIESMPLLVNEALPVHHTATVDETWDGPAAVAAMPNDAKVLKYCHAWQDTASDDGSTADDPDGDADDKKSNYKFPHHKTQGGPANLAACRNGLARLSSADIPDSDQAGVKAHLQAHLDDGGGKSADDRSDQEMWAALADPQLFNLQLAAGKE